MVKRLKNKGKCPKIKTNFYKKSCLDMFTGSRQTLSAVLYPGIFLVLFDLVSFFYFKLRG